MLRIYFPSLLLLLVIAFVAPAQTHSLSGYMRDSATGESLLAGTVYIKELAIGAQTNAYGFYSLSMPAGTYSVIYSYVGYATVNKRVSVIDNVSLNVGMPRATAMKEVVVSATRKDANVRNTEMGTVTLSIAQIKKLPVLLGEVDILKTLQLLPGVQSAGDGNSGFYVRGGGPDQNLVLLDDAVIYNTGHLFGFFSIFNSEAIKDVTLIKGGAPANYGGRLSSVVDVAMKEGNYKEFHGSGSIGNIASKLTLEGPIKKEKGSFMISGRRTYADILARPFFEQLKTSGYFFYDANLKANYRLGERDRLYLSGYMGLDQFKFQNDKGTFRANIPWGNKTATLRWNHQVNGKMFLNTTAVYSRYDFSSSFEQGASSASAFGVKLSSGIRDYCLKSDLDYYYNNKHHLKAGLAYTNHTFIPNQVSGRADTVRLEPNNALIKYAHEAAAYLLDEFDLTTNIKVNAGLRYSYFAQVGPYTAYTLDGLDRRTDSASFGRGELVKGYGGLEPRLNIRLQIDEASSIKTSASRTYQYLHLVSNNGSTLPTDVWVPSTYLVKPQIAWQYSLGYFRNFLSNKLETSVEVYYKDMRNQVQYREGFTPNTGKDPELSFVFGRGTAYGAEFFINKTQGRFTGWLGYTLAWTYLKFPDLNNGNRFPAKYDRRHDISLVGTYDINKKWTISSVFIFGSGNAITLPSSFYFIDNKLVQQFSAVNAYRTPAYHRLDVSATYTKQYAKPRRLQSSWTFSIYNLYNRANPYFLFNDIQGTTQSGISQKIMMVYILPIIPSVTYNFKF
jgi:hypothetical protein